MKPTILNGALLVALAGMSGQLYADAFPQFDMRAMGMGGTGVAVARPASAAAFNPAMLSAARGDDDFQLAFGAGVRVSDPDELIDTADELTDKIDVLDMQIQDLQNNQPTPGVEDARLGQLAEQTELLLSDLDSLNGSRISLGVGGNVGFGVAGQTLGFGVYTNVNVYAAFGPTFAETDRAYLDTYREAFADSVIDTSDPQTIGDFPGDSEIAILAVAVRETALGFSHYFAFGNGGLAVGVAPKKITVNTYDYLQTVRDFDSEDVEAEDYEVEQSANDFDVGAVYRWDNESPWQAGLVVKNFKGSRFDTITGGSVELERQVRAGFARNGETLAFAVDLDVVEYSGFDAPKGSRFLSAGAEMDVSFFQLRAGYRMELGDSDHANLLTVGIGLGPIDLAMIRSGDDLGGGLRIAFGW